MIDNTPNILVPMGFSEQSYLALEQALVFAKAMQANITLLTVVSSDNEMKAMLNLDTNNKSELEEKVNEKLKNTAEEYQAKSGISIKAVVTTGIIYEEIARITESEEATLVIMGTNGKPQNFRKRFIGSNAFRTVTSVDIPVITVKGVRNINKIETIIFPLVLDGRSKEKVGMALHYARLFGSRIKVVSVMKNAEDEKMYNANLNQLRNFIGDRGVECTSELIEPVKNKGEIRTILDYAYAHNGDLMIITEDNQNWGLMDYFVGTDVQAMIYHSEIPVMCVTPSEVKWAAMWEAL